MNPVILAVDTSTEHCSVSLTTGEHSYTRISNTPQSHAKLLLGLVDELMVEAGLKVKDLSVIAFTHGPGSFTGVRIGMSVVQGLAYGVGCPVVTVSSLHTLAQSQLSNIEDGQVVVPALDARMREVYWSAYQKQAGQLCQIHAPQVCSPEDFNEKLRQLQGEYKQSFIGIGHGWGVETVELTLVSSVKKEQLPQADDVITLVDDKLESLKDGESSALDQDLRLYNSVSEVEPLYLRNEVSWEKRKRIRSELPFSQ